MKIDPAEYWSQIEQNGTLERWRCSARRKMVLWRIAVLTARALKRGIDIVGSIGALCAFSPIFLLTALLIKIEDRGPVFFCQKRVGARGRLFGMWKFRSMVVNADKFKDQLLEANQHGQSAVTFKMKDDPRITKVGKWIRKLSYKASHLRRLRVKPGITCLWQIGGRAEIDFAGQVRLDLQYIRSSNWRFNIVILLKTLPAVLFGKGAY